MKKAIRSFFFSSALEGSRATAAVDDTGDYATWVAVSVERRAEIRSPICRLDGLEVVKAVVQVALHGAEWPLLASRHDGNLCRHG